MYLRNTYKYILITVKFVSQFSVGDQLLSKRSPVSTWTNWIRKVKWIDLNQDSTDTQSRRISFFTSCHIYWFKWPIACRKQGVFMLAGNNFEWATDIKASKGERRSRWRKTDWKTRFCTKTNRKLSRAVSLWIERRGDTALEDWNCRSLVNWSVICYLM